jgi:hypothetical protein
MIIHFCFEHIVLLAPACSYAGFSGTLGRKNLFKTCRLFGMLDETECKEAIVPFVYTRSLLYFVSGVVESAKGGDVGDVPILGMNRFFKLDNIFASTDQQAIRTYIGDLATHGSVWPVVAGSDGRSSSSQRHGDFDDDPPTLESLLHPQELSERAMNAFHYAVIVGIDCYPGIGPLRLARGDAREFFSWLIVDFDGIGVKLAESQKASTTNT